LDEKDGIFCGRILVSMQGRARKVRATPLDAAL